MVTPIRYRVLLALRAALEEISAAQGARYDLSGRVWIGRKVYGHDESLPLVNLLEVPLQPDPSSPRRDSHSLLWQMEVMVQGFAPEDRDSPMLPVYAMHEDVVRKIMEKTEMRRGRNAPFDLPEVIHSVEFGPGLVRPADEEASTDYFWQILRFRLVQ